MSSTPAPCDDRDTLRVRQDPFRPMNLIVAEDDETLREAFAESLRAALFDVTTACDGHHVFDHLDAALDGNATMPDALVMDVRMPLCGGIDVLRAVRAAGWTQPVILVTAFPDDALREVASQLGASVVLDKPLDTDDLVTMVRFVVCHPNPNNRGTRNDSGTREVSSSASVEH